MHLRNREKKSWNRFFLLKSVFQPEGPAQGHLGDRAGHLAFREGLDSVPRLMRRSPLDGAPALVNGPRFFGPETDSGFNDDILEAK